MITRFYHWLHAVQLNDALEQRQAILIQVMLLGLIGVSIVGALIPLLTPIASGLKLMTSAIILVNVPVALIAWFCLRRDQFKTSVHIATLGLIIMQSFLLYLTGPAQGGAVLFTFAVPITLAGLLLGRQGLFLSIGLSTISVTIVSILSRMNLPLANSIGSSNLVGLIGGFIMVAGLIGLFIDVFGSTLQQALQDAHSRQHELSSLRDSLEYTVERRTQELKRVLEEVQVRADEQERLLAENERQREAIRELSVPVLPISETTMVMPIVGVLDDSRLSMLQERALLAIERSSARQVLLDITGVPMVDSQVAQGMLKVVQAAQLLGAEVVLIGVRPEVAQAIVSLGIDLSGMRTYSDLQTALSNGY